VQTFTFSYAWAKSVVVVKMSADGKPAWGRMGILTDSARKRNREEVLANYNKTRINIGHQHDRWMELNRQFLFLVGQFQKPLGQMNRNLVGSIYGRSSIKIAHFIPIY
jgi:hypothetical protein